jgi:hypothetical protein
VLPVTGLRAQGPWASPRSEGSLLSSLVSLVLGQGSPPNWLNNDALFPKPGCPHFSQTLTPSLNIGGPGPRQEDIALAQPQRRESLPPAASKFRHTHEPYDRRRTGRPVLSSTCSQPSRGSLGCTFLGTLSSVLLLGTPAQTPKLQKGPQTFLEPDLVREEQNYQQLFLSSPGSRTKALSALGREGSLDP